MPGSNQLPSGSEFAVAISLTWAFLSWMCSTLLLWLTWAHHEGWSYLALLAISSLISNTFSIIQQGRDLSWYAEIVTEQFRRKQQLPGNDPELAIAGGSYGFDLILYYIQYYSYSVQAMLVMFWAAELCQLTYQVGERRKLRRLFRRLHAAGKSISWLLPLTTILCLRIPSLRDNFVAFILIADLPLMLSLAIGSGLMIAVTIKYVQSRKKFTHWSPPKSNSATSGSDTGTYTTGTTQTSSRKIHSGNKGNTGLYDRWLMVRFTIAFILLAVFEVTNTLFQLTALHNNINDAKTRAPDLSTGRAIQTFFLYMPGTTPGIFLFIVFGTTRSSRQKIAQLWPKNWQKPSGGLRRLCFLSRKRPATGSSDDLAFCDRGIRVQRSLTVTSAARPRAFRPYDQDDLSVSSEIWMEAMPKRSARDVSISSLDLKPLTPLYQSPEPAIKTTVTSAPARPNLPKPVFRRLSQIEKGTLTGEPTSRDPTADSLQVPDDYYPTRGDSEESGPILPIQRPQSSRPEVRFSKDVMDAMRRASWRDGRLRNFSRPK